MMTMKSDCDNCGKENEVTNADGDGDDGDKPSASYLQNERGEDYQEQIGMPDEQNMRSWSHHHSTDTVDDPIFRAAMRGYDTVSFVFGLEVTWSLIQHRQQEEDERKALLELETMNEMNELSNETDEAVMMDDDEGEDDLDDPSQEDEEPPENCRAINVPEPAEESDTMGNGSSSHVNKIEVETSILEDVEADDGAIDSESQEFVRGTEVEEVVGEQVPTPSKTKTTTDPAMKFSSWECEVRKSWP